MPSREKILVAMSGGVDSSVAAAMLVEAGHEVVGVFMRLGSPGDSLEELIPGDACDTAKVRIGKQGCCSVGDAEDARLVARSTEGFGRAVAPGVSAAVVVGWIGALLGAAMLRLRGLDIRGGGD